MRKAAVALMAAGAIIGAAVFLLREPPPAGVSAPPRVAGGPGVVARVEVPTVRTGDAQLTGRVRAENGEPVAKARVAVIFADRPSLPPSCAGLVDGCLCTDDLDEALDELERAFRPLAEVETGADGTFRVSGLPAARLEVRAQTETKYGTAIVALDDRAAQIAITVDQDPSPFIRVMGEAGAASVLVAVENGRFLDFARMALGRDRRVLAPAEAVRVISPGYAVGLATDGPTVRWGHDDIPEEVDPVVTVLLRKGEWVRGTLTGGAGPVAGQLVRATGTGACATTLSGPDGSWALGPFARGQFQVRAQQGALFAELTADTYRPTDAGLALKLASEIVIRGTVVDPSNQPVAGADVEVMRFPLGGGNGEPTQLVSTSAGTFEHHAAPGDFSITAKQKGRIPAQARREVETGEWAVSLQLVVPAVVRGRLVSANGQALVKPGLRAHTRDRAHFHILMPQPKVEPTGEFVLETVVGALELDGFAEGMLHTRLTIDAPSEGVQVVLERGGTIEGKVVDERGAPVKDATVTASGGNNSVSDFTDAQGAFAITPLADGAFELTASFTRANEPPFRPALYAPIEKSGRGRAELRDGRADPVLIRLEPVRAVTGRVVDEGGRPLAGVGIAAQVGEGPRVTGQLPYYVMRMLLRGGPLTPPFQSAVVSAADGTFALEGLTDAPHVLKGRLEGLRESAEKPTVVRPGMDKVTLVLHPVRHLIVPVRTAGGEAVNRVSLGGDELVPKDGEIRSEILFTYSGMITVSAPGYAQVSRPVSISPSADTTIAPVVLAKGRPLTVVITDARTQAVIDGWVMVDGAWLPKGRDDEAYVVPAGAFEAKVGAADHLEQLVTVGADQTRLAVALDPGASVHGSVTGANGKALTGTAHGFVVEIGGKRHWGRLEKAGQYAIRGVGKGPGKVWVQRFADQKAGPAVDVDVPATGTITVPLIAP